ncbi:MAG: LPS export ABC transporter periplasmic protein LptC [Pseudobdellovibrio sp.]
MKLHLPKLNRASVFVFLIAVVIFLEIVVMSPQLLEKENVETLDPNSNSSLLNRTEDKNAIEQKMSGAHLVENSGNEKGWELFASEAILKGDGTWLLKKVKVQFFSENQASYMVTGDVGEMDSKTKDMIIKGHTTTTSSNGYSFKTDTVRYVAKQNLMTSDDKVVMNGPDDSEGGGFRLTGEKLLVDIQKNKMSILDKVIANKRITEKDFKLNSTRADFSNKSHEATFTGNVQMNLGTIDVKSPHALFLYSSQRKRLEKIILNDKVEFVDGDKKGFCNELEFDLMQNKMTMRGQPKVVQGEDEIKGHEIVFIDGGKKVKINKEQK